MISVVASDRKMLRSFGLLFGAMVAGLFGLLFPWLSGSGLPHWPWLAGGGVVFWALLAPLTLRPLYRNWMRLATVLSRITTPILLGSVFFLVITPMALVMRLLGRDPMARRFDEAANTYRVPSRQAPKQHMERPF